MGAPTPPGPAGAIPAGYDWALVPLAVAVLALLLTAIELPARAKSSPRSCLHWSAFVYFLISTLGFTAGTFLAQNLVGGSLPGWPLFWHVFFGVFGFHLLIRHTNVTLFDKGVLTIADWVQKALDNAIATSVRKEADRQQGSVVDAAEALRELPVTDLNLYVERYLGAGSVTKLEAAATAASSDPIHYKAFALAQDVPDRARIIVDRLKKRK